MRNDQLGAAALVAVMMFGCGESHVMDVPPPDPGDVTETAVTIGPDGGIVDAGSLSLEIPAGALAEDTEIRIIPTADAAPEAFDAFSPVFRFEPAGLSFDVPATVRLPFAGDESVATIFWTRAGGDEFIARATHIEDGLAVTEVSHFSRAFVGTACTGSCCGRGRGDLDVLMAIDNSNSMAEEQASLAVQLPRVAEILASGDLEGDGVQDFPAVETLHIGIVTADMGAGGFAVPTCDPADFGDDGILRTEGSGVLPSCAPTYPGYATYVADEPGADPSAFATDVACVAVAGTGGCGFEQQLEAALKAVTPSTSSVTFSEGTPGHGDNTNAGFVRADSVLAVLEVTDEDDCSVSDPELFNPSSLLYTEDLNLRCHAHPDAMQPVARYADGLLAMRTDPGDVIFAAIAGIPPGLGGSSPDYAAILSDPLMTEEVDPAMPTRLRPSCDVAGRGLAFPPRRIVETAEAIDAAGGTGVLASICDEDFTPAVDAILTKVAERLSGVCAP